MKSEVIFRNYFIVEKENWFCKIKVFNRIWENWRKLVVYDSMVANQAMNGMVRIVVVGKHMKARHFH